MSSGFHSRRPWCRRFYIVNTTELCSPPGLAVKPLNSDRYNTPPAASADLAESSRCRGRSMLCSDSYKTVSHKWLRATLEAQARGRRLLWTGRPRAASEGHLRGDGSMEGTFGSRALSRRLVVHLRLVAAEFDGLSGGTLELLRTRHCRGTGTGRATSVFVPERRDPASART